MDSYSIKKVYECMDDEKVVVFWDRVMWNRLNMLKHKFICWLSVQGRLQQLID